MTERNVAAVLPLIALVLLAFVRGPALAGSESGPGMYQGPTRPTPFTIVDYTTDSLAETEAYRVVGGAAMKALRPSYVDDWEPRYDNQWPPMRTRRDLGEEHFSRQVEGLSPKAAFCLDATGRTVHTNAFHEATDTPPVRIDAEAAKVINPFTPHLQYRNADYQVVARIYDNSPLVLDLKLNGRIDAAENEWRAHAPRFFSQHARMFDLTDCGEAHLTEWMLPRSRDGILVRPEYGKVGTLQMFTPAGGFRDGFEKLALTCDQDGNGWIEGPELEGLFVWIDGDGDGICSPDEVHPLEQFHVARLGVAHENYIGRYLTDDGKQHSMWNWWPAAVALRKVKASR